MKTISRNMLMKSVPSPIKRRVFILLCGVLVCELAVLCYGYWSSLNPYRNIRATEIKAFCLCDHDYKTYELIPLRRFDDRDFIARVVDAVCHHKRERRRLMFSDLAKWGILIDDHDRIILCAEYFIQDDCVVLHKVVQKEGRIFMGAAISHEWVASGTDYEKLVVDYLAKHKLPKALFYW